MRSVTDDAVVIGLMDYRESDRLVSLYTRNHGKLRGVARSARKSVKRFGGALELFASLTVRFLPRDGLVAFQEADIISIYPGIRRTFNGIALAGYGCDLVDAITPEALSNARIYRLFEAYLGHLDQGGTDMSDRRFFEMNLLNISGFRPPVEDCSVCGAPFSVAGGAWNGTPLDGIRCSSCARGGVGLGGETLAVLGRCLKAGRFGAVKFGDRELAEAGELLDAAIAGCLQRTLNSLAFLRLSP